VTIAGYSPRATWAGNLVVVRLEDGRTVWYAHQSSVAVAPGQRVNAGELIGYVGSTGNSSGAHLHLELQAQGEAVDPEKALVRHGLAL
jgi:murein DD-endopeptidase MepM/ murein hydrolase activator NlpD